jgi:phosphoserine phosphatase
MQAVAILIANPAAKSLTDDHATALGGDVTWLNPGIACEAIITCDDPLSAQADLAARFSAAPIDVAVLPMDHRRKHLLIADMDSTIITVECLDELAAEAGIKPQIEAITERAMRGEIEFEPALRERVRLLRGLDQTALQRTYDTRVQMMPGARALIATMRQNGAYAALVSGGFTYFTERVAQAAGFHEHRANRLEIMDGKLTGKVIEPILGREAKRAALADLTAQRQLSPIDTMAVGDGANDLAMIEAAGLGVAYHAKPLVAAKARVCINHGDLTALLYLQGYRATEFAAHA